MESNEVLQKNEVLRRQVRDLRREVEEMRETLGDLKRGSRRPQSIPSSPPPNLEMDVSDEGDPPRQVSRVSRRPLAAGKSAPKTVLRPPVPPNLLSEDLIDRLSHTIMNSVGDMVNARLAALEKRLPPEKPRVNPLTRDEPASAWSGQSKHQAQQLAATKRRAVSDRQQSGKPLYAAVVATSANSIENRVEPRGERGVVFPPRATGPNSRAYLLFPSLLLPFLKSFRKMKNGPRSKVKSGRGVRSQNPKMVLVLRPHPPVREVR